MCLVLVLALPFDTAGPAACGAPAVTTVVGEAEPPNEEIWPKSCESAASAPAGGSVADFASALLLSGGPREWGRSAGGGDAAETGGNIAAAAALDEEEVATAAVVSVALEGGKTDPPSSLAACSRSQTGLLPGNTPSRRRWHSSHGHLPSAPVSRPAVQRAWARNPQPRHFLLPGWFFVEPGARSSSRQIGHHC